VLACIIGTLVLLVIIVTSSVLGEKRSITLVAKDASGRSVALKPHIVECRGDGVMLYSTGEFIPKAQIARRDTPLRKLLSEVAERKESEYVIVAVRPDGMELFETVRDQIENRGIQIGYEPIDAEWTVKARL
jgi:hypothetical protein